MFIILITDDQLEELLVGRLDRPAGDRERVNPAGIELMILQDILPQFRAKLNEYSDRRV